MAVKEVKEEADLISHLPDELKSRISSFLPIEDAIKTCTLSKKWKDVWKNAIAFEFEVPSRFESERFSRLVENVYRFCNASTVKKLKVWADFYSDGSNVDACLAILTRQNIKELDINCYARPHPIVFKCSSLTKIKMLIPNTAMHGESYHEFNLPNLMVLEVNNEGHQGKNLLENLIRSSPRLEDLSLSGCLGSGSRHVFRLYAPKLKKLRLDLLGVMNCDSNVEAPLVEEIYVNEYLLKNKIMGEFQFLTRAIVNVEKFDSAQRLLFKMDRREDLSTSAYDFPIFKNFKNLVISCSNCIFWGLLPKVIDCALKVDKLYIEQREGMMPETSWADPREVPKCLLFHLSHVKVQGFQGRKWEIDFLKYLLGNANVLKEVIIHCQGLEAEKRHLFNKLLQFPKASQHCNVQIAED